MSVVDDIVTDREQMKNAIFGPAFRLLPRKEGTMSVYLDDAEMAEFLAREGLNHCSDAELLTIADLYDRLGHTESSCGAWFMRYSILGFIQRRKERCAMGLQLWPIGDPVALENFLDRNPALKRGRYVPSCVDCGSELLESGWCNQCSPKRIELMKLEVSKPAKFTAEELRKIEDAVKKEIDGQDELRQAIGYAYLNGLGWRMTKAQQVIDKALKRGG